MKVLTLQKPPLKNNLDNENKISDSKDNYFINKNSSNFESKIEQ